MPLDVFRVYDVAEVSQVGCMAVLHLHQGHLGCLLDTGMIDTDMSDTDVGSSPLSPQAWQVVVANSKHALIHST
jgi:hypothetical protein